MKDKVIVTNIQRFSLHDGPGIRTTVFQKGCSLRCPWCSNPENLATEPQKYIKDGVSGIYGKYYSCDELYDEVIKDKAFYGDYKSEDKFNLKDAPGGVTFSGGEALLQADKLEPLLKRLKTDGIHMAVETCLFVPERLLDIAIQYIDLFYVDIKILDSLRCKNQLGGNIEQYYRNIDTLFELKVPVVFRIPVIGGWTDDQENRERVLKLLAEYHPLKVELIKEHNLGISKYQSLGMDVPDYRGVSDELMLEYADRIARMGIDVEICKI